jgi:hypothetical protein
MNGCKKSLPASEKTVSQIWVARVFRRYFILILLLWLLLVLYPNPAKLIVSLERAINPPLDPAPVEPLLGNLPSDPVAIEKDVRHLIPYSYDWEVHGMPWYFPTVTEVLERGEGDCKARALVLGSVLEAKGIPYRLNYSPIHIWVEYEGKEWTSLENPQVKFYQQDPETGGRRWQFPEIPFSDVMDSNRETLWNPMPAERKALLIFGLPALIALRLIVFRKRAG